VFAFSSPTAIELLIAVSTTSPGASKLACNLEGLDQLSVTGNRRQLKLNHAVVQL
jgi:hypothetical protein